VTGPGGSNSKSTTISVYKYGRPKAQFTALPKNGPAPLQVQFTDTSTGWITSWAWDFGDGGSSSEQSPSHIYTAIGKYKPTLTVTGPGGVTTKTKTIKAILP